MKLRLVAVAAFAITLSACTAEPSTPSVPSVPQASDGPSPDPTGRPGPNPNGATGDGSAARRTALHNAAECIRQHGVPRYQDPVLTADGQVYTDGPSLKGGASDTVLEAIETACGELIRAAKFNPGDQAPPPPRLVQAGVKWAECMRAHGVATVKDPTVTSEFNPGQGFNHSADEFPAGKDDTFNRAREACLSLEDEEDRLSSLGNLDG
ncbi:hypothetical protein OG799_15130 [Micromonospora sp. NBC_00898]|uniref:hypothetical protein n=1 Tax=Micromonospora sp. NBC_00898 TaxID=2975981 RepID=UPI003868B082|nr:hypothetical protein OG799_15130 [Micromonospora sp. NBC_00898]